MGNILKGKKTYLVALGAVLSAVGGFLTGDIALADTLQLIFTGVLGATLRNGLGK